MISKKPTEIQEPKENTKHYLEKNLYKIINTIINEMLTLKLQKLNNLSSDKSSEKK